MKFSLFTLLFGLAAACTNQIVNVRSIWSQPLTTITGKQFCTYTFKIAQGSFAQVDYYGANVGINYIAAIDQFGFQVNLGMGAPRDTYAFPGDFQISIETQPDANIQLALNVTVQKVNFNVFHKFDLTKTPSTLFYINEMAEGTPYRVSTTSTGQVNLQLAVSQKTTYPQKLENIFVYTAGTKLVGTLNGVYLGSSQSLVSYNNEIILYVAKKPVNADAVVLLTDYSNVAQLASSRLFYQTDSSRSWIASVSASDSQQGSATIVGPLNSTATIQQLKPNDSNSGAVSILPGGPKADHSSAISLSNANLPKVVDGFSTFYITKGGASVTYKIN